MATRRADPSQTEGQRLKRKQRRLRDDFDRDFGTRVHRSISWLQRAEKEHEDPDAKFIFLWISFNSAYSVYDATDLGKIEERKRLKIFFKNLLKLDREETIYETLWDNFPSQIRNILNNQYVYPPFWKYRNGVKGYDNWEGMFRADKRSVANALAANNSIQILVNLFDRLYVLRNQLMHGGSTWRSRVNRPQVKNGADILTILIPRFIDLMLDNDNEDWGRIYYRVIE
jgi:hypothetical protein